MKSNSSIQHLGLQLLAPYSSGVRGGTKFNDKVPVLGMGHGKRRGTIVVGIPICVRASSLASLGVPVVLAGVRLAVIAMAAVPVRY